MYTAYSLVPLLLAQLAVFSSSSSPTSSTRDSDLKGFAERGTISLDPTNVDLFFFRAAVSALFKAKAESILRQLDGQTERIVFRQCAADANGKLNELAKCLVSLFNIRDRGMAAAADDEQRGQPSEMPSWAWILSSMRTINSMEGNGRTMEEKDRKNIGEVDKKNDDRIVEEFGKKLKERKGKKMEESNVLGRRKIEESNIVEESNVMEKKKMQESNVLESKKMKDSNLLDKNFALFKSLMKNEKVKKRRRKWKELTINEKENGEEQKAEENGRRIKREMQEDKIPRESSALKKFPNVEKLVKIERFYRLVEKCNEYIQRKDEQHTKFKLMAASSNVLPLPPQRFLQSGNFPIRLSTGQFQRSPLLAQAESQLRGTVHFDKLSILSPKLLSILPEKEETRNSTARDLLFSPTFLSFHEQGDFSLPYLLNLVFTNDGKETLPWLDFLLQISGAASTLDQLLTAMEPTIKEVEQKMYPAILRLEEIEGKFKRLEKMLKGRGQQREEMDARGYTFLDEQQSRLMGMDGGGGDDDELAQMDEEDLDILLEEDIRAIAKMADPDQIGQKRRTKRFLSTQPYGQVRMLNPYFFANQINDSAILRRVVISPKAFSAEILTADFFRFDVLSPEAFVSSILSPRAAMAHILSPTAFNTRILSPQAILAEVLNPKALDAKVLSPRAFSAFVLSPRLLIAEVLSPKAFELRVLNPTTLGFIVLSPTIIGAQVLSPLSYMMVVLSPTILSPGFLNEGTHNVKILSPNILGGKK